MPIDLEKYKLVNNLDKYKLNAISPSNVVHSMFGAVNPDPTGMNSFSTDLKTLGTAAEKTLPLVGGVGGGVIGGTLGLAGGPIGAYGGAVVGSAAGAALGETAKQGIEKVTGQRNSLTPSDIGKQALEYGTMEAIGAPVANVAGKVLEGAGKMLYETAIPTSAKEAALLQTYKAGNSFLDRIASAFGMGSAKAPTTTATTAFKKGLMGTESMIGVQAKKAGNNLWTKLIKPQLKKSTVKIDIPAFFKEAEAQIIKENPEKSMQKSLLEALDSFKEDYAQVKKSTLLELQKFKEGWAKNIPEKIYKGKPIAGAANNVKNTLADIARTKIYDALGKEVRQAYFDYGNLKGIQELGQKAMTGGKLKGGFGSWFSAIKDIALTPSATIGGQTVYKVGQGIEFLGRPGARVIRDLFLPGDTTPSEQPTKIPPTQ